MKVGVLSDTHDNLPRIRQAVTVFNRERVGLVLHAGDFVSPFTIVPLEELTCRLVGVFGNCDGDRCFLKERFAPAGFVVVDEPHTLLVEGKRIALMHHDKLAPATALSGEFDLVVHGHTHRPLIQEGRSLLVNPGECSGWLSGKSTVAIVDLEAMKAELIELE
jgi:putative phosphoesterase